MGDRCYLSIELRGEIKTIEDFEAVVKALEDELWLEKQDVINELMEPAATNPLFEADEVNYANIDDLESVLRERKIGFHVHHGAGGDYGSGDRSYDPNDEAYIGCDCLHEGDAAITLHKLKEALQSENPLEAVKTLSKTTARATGVGLPQFSMSHEVQGWLAIGGPNLKLKEKSDA